MHKKIYTMDEVAKRMKRGAVTANVIIGRSTTYLSVAVTDKKSGETRWQYHFSISAVMERFGAIGVQLAHVNYFDGPGNREVKGEQALVMWYKD